MYSICAARLHHFAGGIANNYTLYSLCQLTLLELCFAAINTCKYSHCSYLCAAEYEPDAALQLC